MSVTDELTAKDCVTFWQIENEFCDVVGEGATEIEAWKDAAMTSYKKRGELIRMISEVMEVACND